MTTKTMGRKIVNSEMLDHYLSAIFKQTDSNFYSRFISPFLINTRLNAASQMPTVNRIIAKSFSEKYLPVGHGKAIAANVPGGRIIAAYPLGAEELDLPSPFRIVMIRQVLNDGTIDEKIYLPYWYTEHYGNVPHSMGSIEQQFAICCILPYVKSLFKKASLRDIYLTIEDQFRFSLKYEA